LISVAVTLDQKVLAAPVRADDVDVVPIMTAILGERDQGAVG
jgi:hypothetical protein